jgi:hypothetical protein
MYRIAFSTLCTALVSTAAVATPATQTAPAVSAQAPVQLAETSAAAPADNAAPSAGTAVEKKICRLLPSSYSHMNDRVCLTKEEWKRVDDQTRN